MNKKNEGQILVVVILVLFILSIIVLGIIAIVTNDVEQSLGGEQYELSYNKSEESIQRILGDYSDTEKSLYGILNETGYSCSAGYQSSYQCIFDYSDIETTVNASDTNEVVDFELGKDQTFKVVLGGYEGVVEIQWTGEVAMLFQLDYQTPENEYKALMDMHDAGNYVVSSVPEHPMQNSIPVQSENRVIINLWQIRDRLGSTEFDHFTGLKIKALMKEDANVSTLLSVRGNAGFPIQVRKLEAVSYPTGTNKVVVSAPALIAQIPFAGSEPEFMNYVIRSNSAVNK